MKAQFLDLHAAADFLGPGRLRSTAIKQRSQTSSGGVARLGRESSRCLQPGILRASLNKRRSFHQVLLPPS